MGDAILLDLSEAELAAAEVRGREAARTEPRAVRAHYDPHVGRVVVDLTNGCTFAFPPRLVQGLEGATDADIAAMEVLGDGYGLHLGRPRRRHLHPWTDDGSVRGSQLHGPPRRPDPFHRQVPGRPSQRRQGRAAAEGGVASGYIGPVT